MAAFSASFAVTFVAIPWLIPRLKSRGIIGKDRNKPGNPEIAEMGGIAAVVGFFTGISILIAFDNAENPGLLQVSLSAILGAAFVGMMDDVFELKQRHKAIFPFLLAMPFASAIDSKVAIPHVIVLDFGPYMIIAGALAVTCAANAANMLEGVNGLGAGLAIIMSVTLIILCIQHSRFDALYVLVPLLGALLAFIWFNKYPAQIFPGDTLMLFVGATLAVAGLLSSLHVQTAFIFLPMIAEFFLKLKGGFKAENYASMSVNGTLIYKGKVESLTHIFMRRYKLTEKSLVGALWALEGTMCVIVIVVDLFLN